MTTKQILPIQNKLMKREYYSFGPRVAKCLVHEQAVVSLLFY